MNRLISIEAPKPEDGGADVVFVRKIGRATIRIKASFDAGLGGWSQWGASNDDLGANVDAVEAWADGMRRAYEAG